MKTSVVRTLIMLSLSAIGAASLLAQGAIYFTTPFDFTTGTKSFAAGDDRVEALVPQVLAIRSIDGRSSLLVMTHAAQTNPQGKATVTFNRYVESYFLSGMANSVHGWELPKSQLEKELIAKKASPTVIVATSSTK